MKIANKLNLGGIALAGLLGLVPATASAVPVEVALDCSVPILGGRFAICGGDTGGILGDNVTGWNLVFEDMQHLVPPDVDFLLELDFSFPLIVPGNNPPFFTIGNVQFTDMDTIIPGLNPPLNQGPIVPANLQAFNTMGTWTVGVNNELNGATVFIHDFHFQCEPGVYTCDQVSLNAYRFINTETGFLPGIWEMPEPDSIALLGLGLLATGAVARRRRKAA